MKGVNVFRTSSNHNSPSYNKPVFQSYPARGNITIRDVREVHDICCTIPDLKNRNIVYEMNGMDGDAVVKYIDAVEKMYLSYHMPSYKTNVKEKLFEKFEYRDDNRQYNIFHKIFIIFSICKNI